jgi:Na+/proline symporter
VEYLSFFYLIATLGRGWKGLLVVLTVGLACSTADSVQNAMTTILAVEIARLSPPNASSFVRKNMIWIARAVALVLQAPAIGLALGRLNVLQLFLVADLILLSIAVPLFGGLWQTMTQVRGGAGRAGAGRAGGAGGAGGAGAGGAGGAGGPHP